MFAWVFPGQGSQSIGMAAGLNEGPARDVWEIAENVLGWDLFSLCVNGPAAILNATEYAQLAILTASVAGQRALEATGLCPDVVSGHSVGEFAALVAGRALTFEDALRLVAVRGRAMAASRDGAMAALIGIDAASAKAVCDATPGVVVVANVNAPGQVVISGERASVDAAIEAARAAGARKAIALAVSVAAHSPLMQEAARELEAALDDIEISEPAIPFVSSTVGRFLEQPDEIKRALVGALTRPVDWPRCIETLQDAGARTFVEVGPGRVLTGLNKRIAPDATLATISTCDEALAFAAEFAGVDA